MKKYKYKKLFFDIETAYMEFRGWRIGRKVSISHKDIIKHSEIICIAYWWEGSSAPIKVVHWEYNKTPKDKEMLKKFFEEVVSKANEVVAHFGDGFDVPWFYHQSIVYGLNPMDIQVTDTKTMAKKFRFQCAKLDYLASLLGFGYKNKMDNDDWVAVASGCKKTLKKMCTYCIKDVDLLIKVYNKLNQYTTGKITKANENDPCHHCGKHTVQKWDIRVKATTGFKYQRYRCNNCGKCYTDNRQLKECKKVK